MSEPYGAKHCRCWFEDGAWLPNAACYHHGILADYTERKDTGVYTVISKPVTIEPRQDLSTPPDGPECPPGVHSMFDPCPGGCLEFDDEPTTEEERRGVAVRAAAAVRRAWSRLTGRD